MYMNIITSLGVMLSHDVSKPFATLSNMSSVAAQGCDAAVSSKSGDILSSKCCHILAIMISTQSLFIPFSNS